MGKGKKSKIEEVSKDGKKRKCPKWRDDDDDDASAVVI